MLDEVHLKLRKLRNKFNDTVGGVTMSRLQMVLDKWKDLENSYNMYYAQNNKVSKRVFLEYLLSYSEKVDSPVQLKTLLQEEVESYSPAEFEDYEALILVLDNTYQKLRSITGDIINLDEFVYSNLVQQFSIEDMEVLNAGKRLTDVREALSNGYFVECVTLNNEGIHEYILGNEQPGYLAFRNLQEVAAFLHRSVEEILLSDFHKQIYYLLANYVMNGKLILPTVFIDKMLYEDNGNSVCMGNTTIPVNAKNKKELYDLNVKMLNGSSLHIDKVSYYNKTLKLTYGKIFLVFVR